MKKIILVLFLLLVPVFVSASIDKSLYFGMVGDSQVKELQQFLISKGFLIGNATGNYYTLTFNAVKKYQGSKNIKTTGSVGPLTRQAINAESSVATAPDVNIQAANVSFKGTFDLAQSKDYAGQSVMAPQTKFKLGDFTLTNNSNEPINLKKIEADLLVGSDMYISNVYVSHLYVVCGSKQSEILNGISYKNYWATDYQLPVGQTTNLSLYGDVNSYIPINSVLVANILVSGTSALTNTELNTNSNVLLSGQNITFGTGSLVANIDGSTPAQRIVAIGKKVVAGKFQFKANNDSYNVSELKFTVLDKNAAFAIINANLYDQDAKVLISKNPAQVSFDGRGYVLDFNINLPIDINQYKTVTLTYNLNPEINSTVTNINIAPTLVYVKALNGAGVTIDGSSSSYRKVTVNNIDLPPDGLSANNLYLFRSFPTFTSVPQVSSIAANNSNANLYTFSIGADPAGDISIKQLTFLITINDPNKGTPHLNNFSFLKENSDYTNSVSIGNIINNNYISLANSGVGIGMTNKIVVTFIQDEKIPAGKTQTYSLKAITNNFISTSVGADSISTSMPSDGTYTNGGNYLSTVSRGVYYSLSGAQKDFSLSNNYNLLWSDKSESFPNSHSDLNGEYTKDWYNGFNVLNFPLSGQSITSK